MATFPRFNFGVEIEAVVLPRKIRPHWSDKPYEYFERLALALRNRGLKALADRPGAPYRAQHPEHYTKWFITRDGSLQGTGNQVCLEAVSPVLKTGTNEWKRELELFWEAARVVFEVTSNFTCGSHIHVTPLQRQYTLAELKSIAFAIITQEHLVRELLPARRRNNDYCKSNSAVSPKLIQYFRTGRNKVVFRTIKNYIGQLTTKQQILELMQGTSEGSRYVIWNFKNIVQTTNTIEFRGGRHLRGPNRTNWWLCFAITFISLALKENQVSSNQDVLYVIPSRVVGGAFEKKMYRFWENLKQEADRIQMGGYLPASWKTMTEGVTA